MAALLALALGSWFVLQGPSAPDGYPLGESSVAILPFESLPSGTDGGYLAAGIHEEVITRLVQVDGVRVVSRRSVRAYRNTDREPEEIAEELGVAALLEGSVRREGDRVRVTAQLIDPETGEHIWAKTYDREIGDVFGLQSDLAARIARSLDAELTADARRRMEGEPPADPAAYDLFLRAKRLEGRSREQNETAVELYRQAVALDSAFAPPWAGLAGAYNQRVRVFGYPDRWADSAARLARHARALDPGLPAARYELGVSLLLLDRAEEAIRVLRQGVEANPGHAGFRNALGVQLAGTGRLAEAHRHLRQAARLSPRSAAVRVNLAGLAMEFGRDSLADAWLRAATALCDGPGCGARARVLFELRRGDLPAAGRWVDTLRSRNPDGLRALTAAAAVAHARGDLGEARRLLERVAERTTDGEGVPDIVADVPGVRLARLRTATGDRAAGRRLLDVEAGEARSGLRRSDDPVPAHLKLAAVESARGRTRRALDHLERAHEAGWRRPSRIRRDLIYAPLADAPRFRELMRRIERDLDRMRKQVDFAPPSLPADPPEAD